MQRVTIGLTAELDGEQCTALAVTPGWLRSEAMLEHYGVTEQNWRDATAREPHFCISESPSYVGRGIAALAADLEVARFAGIEPDQRPASQDLRDHRCRRVPPRRLELRYRDRGPRACQPRETGYR